MAPPRKIVKPAEIETPNPTNVTVEYYDGSQFTFNLVLPAQTVHFVDGVATVDQATAEYLRDNGYAR